MWNSRLFSFIKSHNAQFVLIFLFLLRIFKILKNFFLKINWPSCYVFFGNAMSSLVLDTNALYRQINRRTKLILRHNQKTIWVWFSYRSLLSIVFVDLLTSSKQTVIVILSSIPECKVIVHRKKENQSSIYWLYTSCCSVWLGTLSKSTNRLILLTGKCQTSIGNNTVWR